MSRPELLSIIAAAPPERLLASLAGLVGSGQIYASQAALVYHAASLRRRGIDTVAIA
jgi:hypothetical protein